MGVHHTTTRYILITKFIFFSENMTQACIDNHFKPADEPCLPISLPNIRVFLLSNRAVRSHGGRGRRHRSSSPVCTWSRPASSYFVTMLIHGKEPTTSLQGITFRNLSVDKSNAFRCGRFIPNPLNTSSALLLITPTKLKQTPR